MNLLICLVLLLFLYGFFVGLFFLYRYLKQPSNQDKDSFMQGLIIVFLSHIVYACLVALIYCLVALLSENYSSALFGDAILTGILALALLFFIWIIQLIYVVPLAIFFKRQGKQNTFLGIIVGAGVTFLLGSGICAVTTLGGR